MILIFISIFLFGCASNGHIYKPPEKREYYSSERLYKDDTSKARCVIYNTQSYHMGKWRGIEDTSFVLNSGRSTSIDLREMTGRFIRYNTNIYAFFDGFIVSICPYNSLNDRSCIKVVATDRERTQSFSINNFMRGNIICKYYM